MNDIRGSSAIRQAVFRADASVAIGAGHVVRCLTLARALRAKGWHCAFACRSGTVEQTPIPAYFEHLRFNQNENEPEAMLRWWAKGVDLVVVDHYDLDATFEKACRGWAARILAVDDLANRSHESDFLIDQTYKRGAADYRNLVPTHCRLLLGTQYALLRPEFSQARKAALARRKTAPPLRRVMVAIGSSDPTNFTTVALDALSQSGLGVDIDVVLGSGAPFVAAVRRHCQRHRLAARLHVDVSAPALADLMTQADFAIGSGGISVWERCCLGLASVLVVAAENQRYIIENLFNSGAAIGLGDAAKVDVDTLCTVLQRIAGDDTLRFDMSSKAADICDGNGIRRVVEVITGA